MTKLEDMAFAAQIVGASFQMTADVRNRLIESLSYTARLDEARVALIRRGVEEAFRGPYMPSERVVLSALYPSDAECAEWLSDHYADWRDPASEMIRCSDCW